MFKGWRRHESRRENLAHAYDLGMYILLEVQGRAFRIPLDRCHVNISGKDMMFAWEGMRKDEEGRGRTGNQHPILKEKSQEGTQKCHQTRMQAVSVRRGQRCGISPTYTNNSYCNCFLHSIVVKHDVIII
eukprot:scpid93236/ scgid3981/ 